MFVVTLTFALVAALGAASLDPRNGEPAKFNLLFDCHGQDGQGNGIPDICTNICWAILCKDATVQLGYDNPDESKENSRRKASGCRPRPNRCSKARFGTPGFNCDEYPFASVRVQSGDNVRVNRCVPETQNNRQGGILSQYHGKACDGVMKPCKYSIAVVNTRNIKHCDPEAIKGQTCHDDNEQVGPGGIGPGHADTASSNTTGLRPYRLSDGSIAMSGGEMRFGDVFGTPIIINETLFQKHNKMLEHGTLSDEDEALMSQNIHFDLKTIVKAL